MNLCMIESHYTAIIIETKYNRNGNKYFVVKWAEKRLRVNKDLDFSDEKNREIALVQFFGKFRFPEQCDASGGSWVITKLDTNKHVCIFIKR